jgi:hypothetical protein
VAKISGSKVSAGKARSGRVPHHFVLVARDRTRNANTNHENEPRSVRTFLDEEHRLARSLGLGLGPVLGNRLAQLVAVELGEPFDDFSADQVLLDDFRDIVYGDCKLVSAHHVCAQDGGRRWPY